MRRRKSRGCHAARVRRLTMLKPVKKSHSFFGLVLAALIGAFFLHQTANPPEKPRMRNGEYY